MKWYGILILFLFVNLISAQVKDSLNIPITNTAVSDTSSPKENNIDKKSKKYDVEAVIYATSSDSLFYDVTNKKMYLFGKGDLKYKDTELRGGKISIDYQKNLLEASGVVDTSDTAKVKLKETPVLTENGETYEGKMLLYNFKTTQGYISMAKNQEQDSRYEGDEVKKVNQNTYFVKNGMFTTCDEKDPHTYFTANEMKVIQNDKIIAKWILMWIGGVPLPIPLPFAVIPNQSGRRSGVIIPTYGEISNRGQYFRNFGYFLALSDYYDLTLTGDYYTKGGYGLRSRFRYAKRYDFNGSINAGYSKIIIGEPSDPNRTEQTDWNFSLYHNQDLNPTTRLDANLQFMSSTFLSNNAVDYNDLLSQDIISNATFSKRWDESGNYLVINYSRTQNLQSGNIYETLPSITFTKNLTYPFKSDNSLSTSNQKWYEQIAYNYTGQFVNRRNKINGALSIRGGIQHNLAFSASPKIGYFNVSPRINYTEKWYNKRLKIENHVVAVKDPKSGQISYKDSTVNRDINEINSVRTFDLGVSASTKLYGIFQPNLFGIEAFRHTLIPSISYSYQPNFANDNWGYYDSYKKADGTIVRYDKFNREVFGGAPSGERQFLNFSLGNVFEIKTLKDPADTNRLDDNKIQLLNLTANIGYNFAADSLKFSDLSLSYRTQVGKLFDFSGSSSYTFYDFKDGLKINKFLASEGKGLFRLTNFNFSISTNISGSKKQTPAKSTKKTKEETEEEGFNAFKKADYITLYNDNQPVDFTIPWNLSLSYNYNLSKPTPNEATKFSNLSLNMSFNLTEYWKFTIRGSYDFERKEITAPQITIYRDLHCWELNFTWNPTGYYRGYRLEIRMKAPELQDIKVTKSGGLYSGRR
ncbi:putative LPS assembly protein LptD [Melioribacteraceae bacterium 4301-Me]|uniref:putative LPS assembly protein LptD n=1 Tax=Pyranulibacter aquaticus TaxID=3163344 RepID=UPI003594EFBA